MRGGLAVYAVNRVICRNTAQPNCWGGGGRLRTIIGIKKIGPEERVRVRSFIVRSVYRLSKADSVR